LKKALNFYKEQGCDAIVAFGGGSSMDASKAIAVAVTNPGKPLRKLAGYFKGLQSDQDLCGSHYRWHWLRSDGGGGHFRSATAHTKMVIVDTRMVPKMAALRSLRL
jgi:alcohol dehydrogenase